MRLPHADEAIVPVEKLRDYVLSRSHPVGRTKAKFFAGLGYTEGEWRGLEADLRSQHLQLDAKEVESSKYGRKFVITGPFTGPSGGTVILTSVWVIRAGEERPRFVTAYPGE